MKRLYILRHAKSSWDQPGMVDFDRPLNNRGLLAAPFIGELIAGRGYLPDLIISSPAKRASETASLVKESSGVNAELQFDERIYEASPHTLRQVVAELSDDIASAMLVGHNPGMEGLIRVLASTDEPMPTAALAVINLDIDKWADISAGCGKIEEIIRPKEEMRSL